jgi:hypothetical protein
MSFLPTEDELKAEIEKQKEIIAITLNKETNE